MSASETGPETRSAAEVCAECFVPALFAERARRLADAASAPAQIVTATKR